MIERPPIWAYLAGTFGAQFANNALQVTLPLILLQFSDSPSAVGFVTALTTAMDTAGTLLGGWLSGFLHPRRLLILSTFVRSASLALIPLLWSAGSLTLTTATGVYLCDSLARGVADTARNTMPLMLVQREKKALDWLNSRYQTVFELGAVVGPLLVGLLFLGFGAITANWLVPVAFALATAIYLKIPNTPQPPREDRSNRTALRNSVRAVASNPLLNLAFVGTLLLTLYPLRAVLPALFADTVLKSPEKTAWLVSLFGLGAFLGSVFYGRFHEGIASLAWLRWSAIGVLLLAIGWIPGSFLPMAACILLFALSNVTARLSMVSTLQSQIPPAEEGGIMGLNRFSVNLTSMLLRFLVGLAFLLAASSQQAFAVIGLGLGLVAGLQLWLSRRLAALSPSAAGRNEAPKARPSAAHGMPGRLIVFEGLDGSGKSTQIEMLRVSLEKRGVRVVTTSWNLAPYVAQAIAKAKTALRLTPHFLLQQAINTTDKLHRVIVEDRFNKVVLPALQEGDIVLSDRYFYTSLARDRVRGIDPRWLRQLYSAAIRPDLVLYFRLPPDAAIFRVIERSENGLRLSEEFDEGIPQPAPTNGPRLKYLEAGLDLRLSDDPLENFRIFQTRVAAEYGAMVEEFGFHPIETHRSREEIHEEVLALVVRELGSLSSFARKENGANGLTLFDKDPATDPHHLRKNYLHESRGIHFYFRNMLLPMQKRFAELVDHSRMPRVFLHGSPHIDNYSKSEKGAAMVDFDRSRYGPYAWDIVRLLVSVSLRQKEPHEEFLDPSVLQQFMRGYLRGFRNPEQGYEEMEKLRNIRPGEKDSSTDAYLKANKSWVQEMRRTPLPLNHPDVTELLASYLESRHEMELFDEYQVEEAGRGFGSMGRDRVLIVLAPKDPQSGKDRIFLEIKRVREDPDTEWYKNPFDHHGKRMNTAAELYASGWTQRPGFATHQGLQYWGHQIPCQNVKLKEMLDLAEQRDFAYTVGTQLGRGHSLSLQEVAPKILKTHLRAHFEEIVNAGKTIKEEIESAYARYMQKMTEQGIDIETAKGKRAIALLLDAKDGHVSP